jgi:hypothetical protein
VLRRLRMTELVPLAPRPSPFITLRRVTFRAVLEAAIAAAVAGLLAVFTLRALPGSPPADGMLPLFAILCALASARFSGAGEAAGSGSHSGLWTIPLLFVVAIALPAELRLQAWGFLLAVALTIAAVSAMRRGSLPIAAASWLLAVAGGVRLFPFEPRGSMHALVAIAGGIGLLFAAAHRPLFQRDPAGETGREVAAVAFLLALAMVLVAPLADWRGAVLPALAALIILGVRNGRIDLAIASILLGLLGGLWMAAGAAAAMVGRVAGAWLRPAGLPVAVPVLGGTSLRGVAAALLFAPGASIGFLTAPAPWRLAAAAVLALSLLVRPLPAVVLSLVALMLLVERPGPLARRFAAVPGGFAFGLMVMAGVSGAIAPLFPAALPFEFRLVLTATAAVALLVPVPLISALLLASGAVVSLAALPVPHRVEVGARSLAPGESAVLAAPASPGDLRLVLSGANVAGLPAATPFATVEILDREGRGLRRGVELGEVADWAAFRSGSLRRATNRFPLEPGFRIEEKGRNAWLRGEGVIEIEGASGARWLRVSAAPTLPPDARVLVERMEIRR